MECTNIHCCRGHRHPQEDTSNNTFACRNCKAQITAKNLGEYGGCRMCGACAEQIKRCGHCGRPVV